MDQQRIIPVCLAGGVGARMAPISTADCPKPFIMLPDGSSLLQRTLRRVSDAGIFAPPILIGASEQRFALLNHARAVGCNPHAILLEPHKRNTALAIASVVALSIVAQSSENTLFIFVPADHVIDDETAWKQSVKRAADHARAAERITLIGMAPHRASPEFGYMQLSGDADDICDVTRFVEKPVDAENLVGTGGYFINSGQVIGTACALREAFETYAPNIWQAACAAVAQGTIEREFFLLAEGPYADALPMAFDRALLEKSDALSAVKSECGWSDIGSADALCEVAGVTRDWFAAQATRTHRPWGFYELISTAHDSQVKRLHVFPRARISMQRHERRAEHWTVIAGAAQVEFEHETVMLRAGESLSIARLAWHRLCNAGDDMLQLMEVQTGEPDESDIERREDDYGRV